MKKFMKYAICLVLTFTVFLASTTVMAAKNYYESSTKLTVETKAYNMNQNYDYTIFEFAPKEVGMYKITSENLVGLAGYNWVTDNPSESTVNSNEYCWECTAVGQGIFVAVKKVVNETTATITVVLESNEIELPPERVPYQKKAEVTPFVFEGSADSLEWVDFSNTDTIVDIAILGEDGLYHLNDINGPVLYVNLYDTEFVNIPDSVSYGQLVAPVFDENGKHIETTDYNETFTEYYNAAYKVNDETGIYPLTADLIEIYQKVGENKNWYGADGWIKDSNTEDGWMFSCMYVVATQDDTNEDNSDNGGNDSADGSSDNGDIQQGGVGNGGNSDSLDNNGGGQQISGGDGTAGGLADSNNTSDLNGGTTSGNAIVNADGGNVSPDTSDCYSFIMVLLIGLTTIICAKKFA